MRHDTGASNVTQLVDLDFVDDEGNRAMLGAELVYDPRDPYAMSMVFQTLPSVTWTFARELLMSGIYEPAGQGDVHIWPCLSGLGQAMVIFEFSSPDGEVLVQAPMRECTQFVQRMEDAVAQGTEEQLLDIEYAIQMLFGEAGDLAS